MLFLSLSKSTLSKYFLWNTIRVSNSLDPDQARQNVGPDLGLNCLQRLSADDTSRQRDKRSIFAGTESVRCNPLPGYFIL